MIYLSEFIEPASATYLPGAIGLAAQLTWPLMRSRRAILTVQAAIGLGYGTQYALLGAWSGVRRQPHRRRRSERGQQQYDREKTENENDGGRPVPALRVELLLVDHGGDPVGQRPHDPVGDAEREQGLRSVDGS